MTRSRRTFTAKEKAAVVKHYMVNKIPVSNLCDELGLQPTQIFQWQKQLFDNAHAAFAKSGEEFQYSMESDVVVILTDTHCLDLVAGAHSLRVTLCCNIVEVNAEPQRLHYAQQVAW